MCCKWLPHSSTAPRQTLRSNCLQYILLPSPPWQFIRNSGQIFLHLDVTKGNFPPIARVVTLVVHLIFKLWMKHSVYERDKLGNKEQIESAVSGNIKADLSPNRDTECCGDTKQHTWSLAWILSSVSLSSKMCLVSSGQNITMSSVHRLYRMEWKQYGDPDTEIAAKLLSTSLSFPMFFSLPPDWLALTLIMRCTLNRSENQRWLYKSGDRIKYWVKNLTHWSASHI